MAIRDAHSARKDDELGPVRCSVVGVQDRALCVAVRAGVLRRRQAPERSHGVCASIAPAPTDRLVLVTVWCLGSAGPVHKATVIG